MPDKQTPPETSSLEEKVDALLWHLERLDKRDKLRTIGGFFRGLLAIIPIGLLLWSSWYFYQNSDEILNKITSMAAKQAIQAQSGSTQGSGLNEKVIDSITQKITQQALEQQQQRQAAAEAQARSQGQTSSFAR